MWSEMKVREVTQRQEMTEEEQAFLHGGRPRFNSSDSDQPLPDLVLPSSPPHRRQRSQSINLPPDPALLQNVGRILRRMSDNFQRGEFQNEDRRSPAPPLFSKFKHP